jgi:hypothetical protein
MRVEYVKLLYQDCQLLIIFIILELYLFYFIFQKNNIYYIIIG